MTEAEHLARQFHEIYERLAPQFGYETREQSRKPWDQVPEQNRKLMIAVCGEIIKNSIKRRKAHGEEVPIEEIPLHLQVSWLHKRVEQLEKELAQLRANTSHVIRIGGTVE